MSLHAIDLGARIRATVRSRIETAFQPSRLPAGKPRERRRSPEPHWGRDDLALKPRTRRPATEPLPPKAPDTAGGTDGLVRAIQDDPAIMDAFDRWDTLTEAEKLEVGRQIARHQGEAFGFTPMTNFYRDPNLAQPGTPGIGGLWQSDRGIALSDFALADPGAFLNIVTHEQAHEMEWQLGLDDGQAHADGDAVYEIGDAVQAGVFGTATLH